MRDTTNYFAPRIQGLKEPYDFTRSGEISEFADALNLRVVIAKNRLQVIRKEFSMSLYHRDKNLALHKFVSLFNKGGESKYLNEVCTSEQIRFMRAFRPYGAIKKLHLQRKGKYL